MKRSIEINKEYAHLSGFINRIPDLFDASGEEIYKGRNILKKYTVDGISLVVKSFKIPHVINRFAYSFLRPSKARRSYLNAQYLLEKGFNTSEPVAYIEEYKGGLLSHSYFISLELESMREMREFWYQPEVGDRAFILEEFGRFVAELHINNILHKDLSGGNILFKVQEGVVQFFLIDINRMKFDKPIASEVRYRNFERLWISDEAYLILSYAYAKLFREDEAEAVTKILFYKNLFMRCAS